jgi:trehalose/maltose hydrolase-like predicted phosphorylase
MDAARGTYGKHEQNNINMDLRGTGRQGVDGIHLAQDTDKWLAVVNMVMNLN